MITKPKFDESVFVCPGAAIVGDVTLGKNVNVWYNAVLRGDDGAIKVGDNTNVQDCAVLHEETTVGSGCTIGHGAIVHGCTVGDNVLVENQTQRVLQNHHRLCAHRHGRHRSQRCKDRR